MVNPAGLILKALLFFVVDLRCEWKAGQFQRDEWLELKWFISTDDCAKHCIGFKLNTDASVTAIRYLHSNGACRCVRNQQGVDGQSGRSHCILEEINY